MIEILLPSRNSGYKDTLGRVASMPTLPPFDPVSVAFIDEVSKAVLFDPELRRLPEMAAVAHWMRKGHLSQLQQIFEKVRGNRLWFARGLCLHFAPSNVDSVFLYSWFISLLLGNSNVVRLSARRRDQVALLLAKIDSVLAEDKYQMLQDRTCILTFDHDDPPGRELSGLCKVRVLWGGDDSVKGLRTIPLNPLATELAFANRFSLALFKAEKVLEANTGEMAHLAALFYRDAYWFDQKACSSPRLVVWTGTRQACLSAQQRFWRDLMQEMDRRKIAYPEIVGLNKLVAAYSAVATGVAAGAFPDLTGPISRVQLHKGAEEDFRKIDPGGGFFFEIEVGSIGDVPSLLSERDQTITHFGFTQEELEELAHSLPARAIDRIVPLGSALEFDVVWDGVNLLQAFSREVDLKIA